MEAIVTLTIKKNEKENRETEVFASVDPVGRDEHTAVGQNDYRASFKVEVWPEEYREEPEIIIDGKKYVIYRTYGPNRNGKMELYVAERTGKK